VATPIRVVLGTLLAATSLASLACERSTPPPNVVLISIDCLSQRQLKQAWSLGGAPSLARLAKDSLVFHRGYAHAPWTTPSHMSILTGLYPSQHGRDIPYGLMIRFNDGEDRVPLFRTLPERLGASGFETVAFVGLGPISAEFGLGQGFSLYHESGRNNPEESDLPETQARIREWFDRRQQKPFLLFFHTYELHHPLAQARRPFRRALDYVDDNVGSFLSRLRKRGLYDSSLIILTGDHGSRMIRKEQKCCVHGAGHYEENLRVPFLVKLPAPGPTGPRDLLVRHVDILPTVLDLVGLPAESYDGPGSSILSRLARGATEKAAFSYSEADGRCWSRRAVVEERYKYIYTPQDPWHRLLRHSPLFFDDLCRRHPACGEVPREELYDLKVDPFEETNLLKSPLAKEAEVALERLRIRLGMEMNLPVAYRRRLTRGSPRETDESVREALRALGYIE